MGSNPGADADKLETPSVPDAISPLKSDVWSRLTPRERLARSWRMRDRLRDPASIHDRKLFPKP
jgi:hypothetical protein